MIINTKEDFLKAMTCFTILYGFVYDLEFDPETEFEGLVAQAKILQKISCDMPWFQEIWDEQIAKYDS